ncbi:hypothetical protein I7I48_05819 [Histoplasma ohiense]|nr:hypothetical protein I7I48_05819 [Histoplasma ohiense (nom. inval.)]
MLHTHVVLTILLCNPQHSSTLYSTVGWLLIFFCPDLPSIRTPFIRPFLLISFLFLSLINS